MTDILVAIYFFIVGAALGSFAGAVAWRLHARRNFVRERSECEHCHHVLGPLDLFPVVSWLWLRGKCRYCKKPIGYSTFGVEVLLGLVFALSYLYWPYALVGVVDWLYLVSWLMAAVFLAILFLYDMRHFLLPDVLIYPLIGIGVLLFVFRMTALEIPYAQWPAEILFGLLPVAGVYWLLYTVSAGKWVGFGDVKLGVFMGLLLGWQGALLALMASNLLGVIWTLPGLMTGKLKRTDPVPFGPFLIMATFLSFIWGSGIIYGYSQLFLL